MCELRSGKQGIQDHGHQVIPGAKIDVAALVGLEYHIPGLLALFVGLHGAPAGEHLPAGASRTGAVSVWEVVE